MRKLFTVFALVAILGFAAAPALAGHNDGCPPYNPNCNQGNDGGDGGNSNDNSNNNLNTAFGGDGGRGGSGGDGGQGGDGGDALAAQMQGQLQGQGQAQGQGQGQMQGNLGINGQQQGIADSGNSSQGQQQGIADSGNSTVSTQVGTSTSTGTSTETGTATATETEQGQDQFGYVDTDLTVEDNSSYRIDNDFPVNTSAPVFAGNCSQGVSAQTMSFGGSIASGNSVCDFIAVAGAYIAGGNRDEAFRVLGKAESAADWRFMFSRIRMVITLGIL